MTNLFKRSWGKDEMKEADNPLFAPSVVQWPGDIPGYPNQHMPNQYEGRRIPKGVRSVERPRFGRGAGYKEN